MVNSAELSNVTSMLTSRACEYQQVHQSQLLTVQACWGWRATAWLAQQMLDGMQARTTSSILADFVGYSVSTEVSLGVVAGALSLGVVASVLSPVQPDQEKDG